MDSSGINSAPAPKKIQFGVTNAIGSGKGVGCFFLPSAQEDNKALTVGYDTSIAIGRQALADTAKAQYEDAKKKRELDLKKKAESQQQISDYAVRRKEEAELTVQQYGEKLFKEMKKNVQARIEAEIHEEVREGVLKSRRVITDNYTKEIEIETRAQLEKELEPVVEAQLAAKLESSVQSHLESELKPKIEDELRTELAETLEREVYDYFMQHERDRIIAECRAQLKSAVIAELRQYYGQKVIDSLRNELQPEVVAGLRTQHRDSVIADLQEELEPSIIESIREAHRASVIANLNEENREAVIVDLRQKHRESVIAELREEYANTCHTELTKENEEEAVSMLGFVDAAKVVSALESRNIETFTPETESFDTTSQRVGEASSGPDALRTSDDSVVKTEDTKILPTETGSLNDLIQSARDAVDSLAQSQPKDDETESAYITPENKISGAQSQSAGDGIDDNTFRSSLISKPIQSAKESSSPGNEKTPDLPDYESEPEEQITTSKNQYLDQQHNQAEPPQLRHVNSKRSLEIDDDDEIIEVSSNKRSRNDTYNGNADGFMGLRDEETDEVDTENGPEEESDNGREEHIDQPDGTESEDEDDHSPEHETHFTYDRYGEPIGAITSQDQLDKAPSFLSRGAKRSLSEEDCDEDENEHDNKRLRNEGHGQDISGQQAGHDLQGSSSEEDASHGESENEDEDAEGEYEYGGDNHGQNYVLPGVKAEELSGDEASYDEEEGEEGSLESYEEEDDEDVETAAAVSRLPDVIVETNTQDTAFVIDDTDDEEDQTLVEDEAAFVAINGKAVSYSVGEEGEEEEFSVDI